MIAFVEKRPGCRPSRLRSDRAQAHPWNTFVSFASFVVRILSPRRHCVNVFHASFSQGQKLFRLHRKEHAEENIFVVLRQRAEIFDRFVPIGRIGHFTKSLFTSPGGRP